MALKFTTAISRKGRFTDILPLMPGSLTFMRELAADSANRARAYVGCCVWLTTPAYALPAVASRAIAAVNAWVSRVLPFMIFSFLWFYPRLLFIVPGIGERAIAIEQGRTPDHAGGLCSRARTPNYTKGAQQVVVPG